MLRRDQQTKDYVRTTKCSDTIAQMVTESKCNVTVNTQSVCVGDPDWLTYQTSLQYENNY